MKNIESPLFNSNGNLKKLPSKFCYDFISFENYNYDEKEHRIYVEIDNDVLNSNGVNNSQKNSTELLYNMITLRHKLSELFLDFKKTLLFFDESYSKIEVQKYLNIIFHWCIKNGYPFADSIQISENKKRLFKINTKPTASFSILDFLVSLNDVYSLYLIYLVVVGEQKTIEEKAYITENNELPISIDELMSISKLTREKYESIFEKKYNSFKLKSSIGFKSDDKSYPYMITKASNLFEAAAYQIALMIYNPQLEIKLCPLCGIPFIPVSPKQVYCNESTCYPQLAYKRKKSLEKKRQKNKPEN